jgi:hypothetical protein
VSIPLSTTTITVKRPARPVTEDPWGEGYDAPAARDNSESTVATAVRAVVSPNGGTGGSTGGESEVLLFRMTCDPCPLSYGDEVLDDRTGIRYAVEWCTETPGIAGLGHVVAGLKITKGRSQ